MSTNVPFPLPQDRRHTQPVVDMFRYVPPVEQTPYADAEKQKKHSSKSDNASIASTSTFASTKALLKNKFSSSHKSSSKDADRKRAEEQAKILRSTIPSGALHPDQNFDTDDMASAKEGPQSRRHGSTRSPGEIGDGRSFDSIAGRDKTRSAEIPVEKEDGRAMRQEGSKKKKGEKQQSSRITLGEAFGLGGTFNAC